MKQHHINISRKGRTGTTLLIRPLTKLDLDTGFISDDDRQYQSCAEMGINK